MATATPHVNGTLPDLSINELLNAGGFNEVHPTQPQPQQAQSQPSALLAAATVLLSTLASTNDHYESVTLEDTIRSLYSRIKDDAEKQKFETLVYGAFKKGQDAIDFIASCQTSSGGNPFDTLLSMDELLAMPPKEWLIDNFIGKGDLGMLYGGSGTGKTHVIVDFSRDACMGGVFANRFKVNRPLIVAYCAGEGVSGMPARFRAAMNTKGISSLSNFLFAKQAPQLHTDKQGQRPDAHIGQFVAAYQQGQAAGKYKPLDILIIDTLHSATAGADENSAGDMGRVLESCREAIRTLGCAVILIHHTGKNGDSERGSSALRGAMDVMIHIKRISETDTKAVMQCTKLKDGEQWKQQTFDLVANGESVAVWWDDPADEVTSKGKQDGDRNKIIDTLRKAGAKLTSKQLTQVVVKSDAQMSKLLASLVDDGLVIRELRETGDKVSKSNPWLYSLGASIKS